MQNAGTEWRVELRICRQLFPRPTHPPAPRLRTVVNTVHKLLQSLLLPPHCCFAIYFKYGCIHLFQFAFSSISPLFWRYHLGRDVGVCLTQRVTFNFCKQVESACIIFVKCTEGEQFSSSVVETISLSWNLSGKLGNFLNSAYHII